MKHVKWLCGLLILVLLLSGCQAVPPTSDGDESTAPESTAAENKTPETTKQKEEYVKQYPYPEGVEYSTYMTDSHTLSIVQAEITDVYTPVWETASTLSMADQPKQAEATFQQKTLSGTYKDSSVVRYDNFYSNHYYNEAKRESFTVSQKTGKLTSYTTAGRRTASSAPSATEEYCVEKAKTLFADLLTVEDYSIRYRYDDSMKVHTVSFVKVIGGIDTVDKLYVSFYDDGEFMLFHSTMLGEISKDATFGLDTQTADAIALARGEDAFRKAMENKAYQDSTIRIDNKTLFVTEDGRMAILYQIRFDAVERGEGWYEPHSSGVEIIVFDTADAKVPAEVK